jgi:glycogen operon protein
MDEEGQSLLEFTRRLIALRREHIVFHRNRFFQGATIPGTEITDVTWLRPDGEAMAEEDWGNGLAKAIALLLSGEAGLIHLTERGVPEADDTFLLLVNASHEDVDFVLPAPAPVDAWQLLVNTAVDPGYGFEERLEPGSTFAATGRSLALLVRDDVTRGAGA